MLDKDVTGVSGVKELMRPGGHRGSMDQKLIAVNNNETRVLLDLLACLICSGIIAAFTPLTHSAKELKGFSI